MKSSNSWHILGAGSIGCLWAGSLCHQGESPRFILRHRRFETLERQSVALKLAFKGQTFQYPVEVVSAPTIHYSIKRLILTTKAQDALPALQSVKAHLSDNCQILLLQNGMGSQQAVCKAFPAYTIWAGSSTDGAYLSAPFHVVHAGIGQTWIGPLQQGSGQVEPFADLQQNFRLKVSPCSNIAQKLWEKLAINCCINALSAHFNCRNGALLDGGEKERWLNLMIAETEGALRALGVKVPPLTQRVYEVCQLTRNNISSTCQDVRQKRTTELAYMNGYLVGEAKRLGIVLPNHEKLLQAVVGY